MLLYFMKSNGPNVTAVHTLTSQILAFSFSISDGYWGLKPMVSLKLVYYRFGTGC